MKILFTDSSLPLPDQPEDVIQVCTGANKWFYYVWQGKKHRHITACGTFEDMYEELKTIEIKLKKGMKEQYGQI